MSAAILQLMIYRQVQKQRSIVVACKQPSTLQTCHGLNVEVKNKLSSRMPKYGPVWSLSSCDYYHEGTFVRPCRHNLAMNVQVITGLEEKHENMKWNNKSCTKFFFLRNNLIHLISTFFVWNCKWLSSLFYLCRHSLYRDEPNPYHWGHATLTTKGKLLLITFYP